MGADREKILTSLKQQGTALHRKWKRALIILPLFLILLTLAMGIDLYRYRGRIYPHIYLSGVSMGGLDLSEAENIIDSKLFSLKEISFIGLEEENRTVSLYDLGISWDKKEMILKIRETASGWQGYPARLQRIFNPSPLEIKGILDVENGKLQAFLDGMVMDAERKPQDARFVVTGTKVSLEKEVKGRSVNAGLLQKKLLHAVREGQSVVIVPLAATKPELTAKMLSGYNFDQVMLSFSTDVSSANPNRVQNISIGTGAINGYLLLPGETFSFEGVVGDATAEKGYREAPVIVGGKLVPGLGGGLCQVSSTLYNAALLANLTIVERYSHSLTIGYLPVGRDATISIGHADLKFKNTRDHPILIGGELKDGTLTFRLFGPPMEERVELFSSDIIRLEPPVHYEKSAALPHDTLELVEKGRSGYHVKTWRIVYSGSREISRELLSHDHYNPVPTVYRIGTGE